YDRQLAGAAHPSPIGIGGRFLASLRLLSDCLLPPPPFGDLPPLPDHLRLAQAFDYGGIEAGPASLLDLPQRLIGCERLTILPRLRQRVEHIGYADETRLERDALAGQAVRIAVPVPALMVRGDDLREAGVDLLERLQDVRALDRVLIDLLALLRGERFVAVQDVEEAVVDLAEIMEKCGETEGGVAGAGDAGGGSEHVRQGGHAPRVALRDGVARAEGVQQEVHQDPVDVTFPALQVANFRRPEQR